MKNQIIKFRAIKVKTRPVKIEFFTKDGEKLWFKGLEAYEVEDPEELKSKDLVRWLRKNKFKSLAKALSLIIHKAKVK